MRESCEIHVERLRNRVLRQEVRFIACCNGTTIAASPPFWASSSGVLQQPAEEARLRDLVHTLTTHGWTVGPTETRGARWYQIRLYKD